MGQATAAAEAQPLPALDTGEIALGRDLYAAHCASCHGTELQGEANWQAQNEDESFRAPPHDASGHVHNTIKSNNKSYFVPLSANT
jgi:mono/diheme cytochrome c family protein